MKMQFQISLEISLKKPFCTNRNDWHTYWNITLDSTLSFLYRFFLIWICGNNIFCYIYGRSQRDQIIRSSNMLCKFSKLTYSTLLSRGSRCNLPNFSFFQDFELNELLNRHFKVCMTIVDENEIHPELKKDIFWNQSEPEFIEQPDVNDAEKLGISEDFVFQ